MTDCCVLVFILFQSEEPPQSPNISPAVLPEEHSNDPHASPTNYEGIPAIGVISPNRLSILTAHIIWNNKFNR